MSTNPSADAQAALKQSYQAALDALGECRRVNAELRRQLALCHEEAAATGWELDRKQLDSAQRYLDDGPMPT